MSLVCVNGHENPDGNAFCASCGSPLAQPAAGSPLPPPVDMPPPPVDLPPPPATPAAAPPPPVPPVVPAPEPVVGVHPGQVPPGPATPPGPPSGPGGSFAAPAAQPPAQPPAPPGPPTMSGPPTGAPGPAAQEPQADAGRRSWLLPALVLGALLLVAGGVGAWFLFGRDSGGSSDLVVFAEPDGDRSRLFLGRSDDDPRDLVEFADDASLIPFVSTGPDSRIRTAPAVVPHDGGVMAAWSDGEESVVAMVRPDDSEPEELFSEDGYASISLDDSGERYMIDRSPPDGGSSSCYVGVIGERPERIGRADSCDLHGSGRIVAMDSDDGSDDEFDESSGTTSYEGSIYDFDGEELGSFSVDGYPTFSPLGGRLSAVGQDEVVVLDADDGSEVATAEGDELLFLGWATRSETLLYGASEDGAASLRVIDEDGGDSEVLRGPEVTGQLTADGSVVIGAARQDDQVTLSRIEVGGEPQQLLEGDGLDFALLGEDAPKVIAWSTESGSVWFGDAMSGEPAAVGEVEDLGGVSSVSLDEATGVAYLVAYAGDDAALFRIEEDGLTEITDSWNYLEVHQIVDGRVVVTASDGDEAVLLLVDGDEAREIDTAPQISEPLIEGSRLVWSSIDDVDDRGDAEVRSVGLGADDQPETLQRDLRLEGRDVGHDRPWTSFREEGGEIVWIQGGPVCEDYPDLTNSNDEGEIDGSEVRYCLAVPSSGASVTVSVRADLDTTLTLLDESGSEVDYNDDFDGSDPFLDLSLGRGVYTVVLEPYDSSNFGSYSISASVAG